MFRRFLFHILLFLAALWAFPLPTRAQMFVPDDNASSTVDESIYQDGFAKPYEYEREAYGYDPEGIIYHENEAEDFQVVFITAAPFVAGASFLLTGLASMVLSGNFQVGGNYFLPFLGLTLAGSTTIACVSVLPNKYPPPDAFADDSSRSRRLAFEVPLATAKF